MWIGAVVDARLGLLAAYTANTLLKCLAIGRFLTDRPGSVRESGDGGSTMRTDRAGIVYETGGGSNAGLVAVSSIAQKATRQALSTSVCSTIAFLSVQC